MGLYSLPLNQPRNTFPGFWFIRNTDPATDFGAFVGPGTPWLKTTNDTSPWGALLGFYVRNSDDTAWELVPATSVGGDADTLEGHAAAYFATAAALAAYIPLSQKGAASGVAELDGSGKIISSQLPAIALIKATPVADLAARLALTAQQGDVAVQADTSRSYMLKEGGDPSVDADWVELVAPTGAAPSGASFITYATEAALGAERVLTDSTDITGDVSVAGVFKLFLANLAVTTAKLAARAVTWAKLQAVSTGILLGRTTAGSGDVEEITPSARFSLSGGALDLSNAIRDVKVPFVIDGGGSVIVAGSKGVIEVPAGALVSARLLGDQASGSITVDLRRTTYADYAPGTHPVAGDSIIGAGTALAISAAAKYEDTTFTGWTSTAFSANDLLEVVVTGTPATHTRVSGLLTIRRS